MADGYYRVYLLVKYTHAILGQTVKKQVYVCTIAVVGGRYLRDSAEYDPDYRDIYDACMLEMIHTMLRTHSRHICVEGVCNVLEDGLYIAHPEFQRFNENIYPEHPRTTRAMLRVVSNVINYPDLSLFKDGSGEWLRGDSRGYRLTSAKCPCNRHRDDHKLAKDKHEINKIAMRTAVLPLSRMIPDSNVVKYIAQYLLWNINYHS